MKKLNLKYASPDWGLEDCEILYKSTDGLYLILSRGKGKKQPQDAIVIVYYDEEVECFRDMDINWMNIKKNTIPKPKKK